ncbi:MAG: class F sortase, partial [Chloroflexi bacterium]|nr:class F sortase [Chloroflexota bacterium]
MNRQPKGPLQTAVGVSLVAMGLVAVGVSTAFLALSVLASANLGSLEAETALPLDQVLRLPDRLPGSVTTASATEPPTAPTATLRPPPSPAPRSDAFQPLRPPSYPDTPPDASYESTPDGAAGSPLREEAQPSPTPVPTSFRRFQVPESSLGLVVVPTVAEGVEATAYGVPLTQQRDESRTIWSRADWTKLAPEGSALPRPRRILIPAIQVDSSVVEINVVMDGGTRVWQRPAWSVGYHAGSARPGERGNAVLSGHISSPIRGEGAVFNRLPEIADLVKDSQLVDVVVYAGDNKYLYRVTRTTVVNPEDIGEAFFTTEESTITLITCVP